MAKTPEYKLKYQAEYQKRPERVKIRVQQNAARQDAIKAGLVKKGDGKEVDHIKPLDSGGSNTKGNTRIVSEKTNASWRKGQSGFDPSKQKK